MSSNPFLRSPSLVCTVMVALVHLSHGLFSMEEPPDTFCEALETCRDKGGSLPLSQHLPSLQDFMRDNLSSQTPMATWMLEDKSDERTAVAYCRGDPAPSLCPGLVALPAAVNVLRHPLANCTHSSVDVAVCEPPSWKDFLRDWLESLFSMTEVRPTRVGRLGTFCHAWQLCQTRGKDLVESEDIGTENMIRESLRAAEKSSCWVLSEDDDGDDLRTFCARAVGLSTSIQPESPECPGQIILQSQTDKVKASIIGCDVPLPVVCVIPESTTGLFPPVTSPTDTATPAGQGGSRDDGNLPVILGVVAGVIVAVVIIVVVVIYLIRKKTASSSMSDNQTKMQGNDAQELRTKENDYDNADDVVSRTRENDYADVDYADIRVTTTGKPLPSAPPPIGADPGYAEIPDVEAAEGKSLGNYEEIDVLRQEVHTAQAQGDHLDSNGKELYSTAGVGNMIVNKPVRGPDVPTTMPIYAQPTPPVPAEDLDPEEVTLVENTVYAS